MKIMTFNLCNYDDQDQWHKHWPIRLQLFANIINQHQPDIISFQEVRFNPDKESSHLLYQNMGEQILCDLNLRNIEKYEGSTILTQPVMFYSSSGNNSYSYPIPSLPIPRFQNTWCEWEGLSIIAVNTNTVIETGSRFLSIVESVDEKGIVTEKDPNKRSVKYAKMKIPSGQIVYIFNCHYSYDIDNFQENVKETLEYIKPFLEYPCLLMGDMNQTEEDKDPSVARKVKESFDLLKNEGLNDIWKQLRPDDPGYTDRTEPQRIDYIWANFNSIDSIDLVGKDENIRGIYASDHYGLITQVTL